MNGGRFDLIRFSAGDSSSVKQRWVYFQDTVNGSFCIGKEKPRHVTFISRMSGSVRLIRSRPRVVVFNVRMYQQSFLRLIKSRYPALNSYYNMCVTMNIEKYRQPLFITEANIMALLSKEASRNQQYITNIACTAALSRDMYRHSSYMELVQSFVSVISVVTQSCSIYVTIPPGGELRIDSENYQVLLNSQNIIHQHQGDWITLDRNLLELIVDSSGTGSLDGQLIFHERYL